MAQLDWRPFLQQFSREVLADKTYRALVPDDVAASGWLGFPPTAAEEIEGLEQRLGTRLPPSYRSLLQTTNGWRTAGAFVYDLLPCSEVGWFRERHADWIEAWNEGAAQYGSGPLVSDEEYFVYGEGQDCCNFRDEHWRSTLAISGIGDSAIYLLNPMVQTAEGEWEAWFFANWNPGATRYRSFWDMMQAQLANFVSLRDNRC